MQQADIAVLSKAWCREDSNKKSYDPNHLEVVPLYVYFWISPTWYLLQNNMVFTRWWGDFGQSLLSTRGQLPITYIWPLQNTVWSFKKSNGQSKDTNLNITQPLKIFLESYPRSWTVIRPFLSCGGLRFKVLPTHLKVNIKFKLKHNKWMV